jgi:hypothetical protein
MRRDQTDITEHRTSRYAMYYGWQMVKARAPLKMYCSSVDLENNYSTLNTSRIAYDAIAIVKAQAALNNWMGSPRMGLIMAPPKTA